MKPYELVLQKRSLTLKPLVTNKVFRFILFASLIIFSIQNLSYGQQENTSTQGIIPISKRTPQVRDAIAAAIGVDADAINETHLAAVTSLNLRGKSITSLKTGDFSGLTALTNLNLHNNQLNSLPDGIFSGLTSLQTLRLAGNAIEPLPIEISLQQVAEGQFKAVTPTGSPFDIVLPIVVTNGNITDGTAQVTIPKGSVESRVLNVSRPDDMITAVTIDIGTLPECPPGYYGCMLSKSGEFPLNILPSKILKTANTAPVFREGPNTTRIVGETAVSGSHIGSALAATDADNDELTFSLGGPDAAAFSIENITGQLTAYAPLNYKIKSIYTVTATVSDGSLTDTLTVTIHVNAAPKFPEGEVTTRVVMEDTLSGTTLGKPILATDLNGDPLTYTLGGIDAEAFELDYDNYLKTRVPLGYDDRSVYCVTITAADGSLTDTITVVTSVIGTNDTFMSGKFVPVHERTSQVRDAIVDALPDVEEAENVTLAHLATITHLNLRNSGISKLKSGDFSGLTALTDLNLHNNYLSFLPKGIFKDLTMLKTLRLGSNAVKKASVILYLKQVSEDEFKVVVPSGAPFDMILPVTVINGVITHGETPLVIPQGETESATFGVACPLGRPITPTVVLNTLPQLPPGHYGYRIAQSTVHLRTPQVAKAITDAVPDVTDPHYVTDIHLAAITTLKLDNKKITSLKVGDFAGMLSLRTIFLQNNKLKSLPYNIFSGLRALTHLDLSGNEFTSVPSISYDGLFSLSYFNLSGNRLTSLSESSFVGIPDLEQLHLSGNVVDPLRLRVKLEKVGDDQVKAVVPAGAPFTIYLPITVQNGKMANGATPITVWTGEMESQLHTVIRSDDTTDAVTASIGTFPDIPEFHTGYFLGRSDGTTLDPIPLAVIEAINVPPVFTEGDNAVRTVPEDAPAGTYIGTPITATDTNKETTLVYTLGGIDADSFDIDEQTGQLKTKVVLDYETKPTYTITITVTDGTFTDTITVTINISDIEEILENNAPVFAEDSSTTRSIPENTDSGVNIGTPITATDADGDTLTYSLGATDTKAFSIDSKTGQLQTKAALDYETKSSYTLTITADDGNGGSASIDVTINVTDINEQPVNGDPISEQPENEDPNNQQPGNEDPNNQQPENGDPINEQPGNNAPVFTEGSSTTRSVAENTGSGVDIGSAVTATDADGDALTYSLGGTDAHVFSIDSTTGQLRTNAELGYEAQSTNIATNTAQLQTKAALDYEAKPTYTVTITADDGNGGSTSIDVTINITDIDGTPVTTPINEQPENNVPVFTEGSSTTRSIAENTDISTYFGTPITAIDPDGDTLTYSLNGTDAKAFTVDSTTGQLQTSATLDYETKSSYSVTITASDGKGGITSIDVTINITDINETPVTTPINEQPGNSPINEQPVPPPINEPVINNVPVFTEGSSTTRSIAENTASNVSIGDPISATDADEDTITYSLGGIDANAFVFDSTNGQLKTSAALDYETKPSYSVTVTASDGNGGSVAIAVTINITDIDETPVTPPLNEQPGNTPIDEPVVNNAPVFTEGSSTTRSIAENTASGTDIGKPVAATDADGDTLTYSLGGTNANAFTLASKTGQLKTKAALDYETKSSYSVTIKASDGNGGSASITVTINITREQAELIVENRPPVFTEGSSTTRSVAENTAAASNIGSAVTATDPDNDTLTYKLYGTDKDSFSINSATGQLQTSAALDYETKSSYSITIRADDGNGGSASIDVTVNVTNVNDNAPMFTEGDRTARKFPYATSRPMGLIGGNIGAPVSATDADGDTLTYSFNHNFPIFLVGSTNGQLMTFQAFDLGITVTLTVSDGTFTDTIDIMVNSTGILPSEAPVFTDGSSTTRSIAENSPSGMNIGGPVSATDVDSDTLTYSLGGTDAASFGIDSSTGQLQTSAVLDYETRSSYSVTVTADDGTGSSATITVTINVTDGNDAPVFTEGSSTTRSVHRKIPGPLVYLDVGSPVTATDPNDDSITYSLSGTDTHVFSINQSTGQLRTLTNFFGAITRNTFSVEVIASDGLLSSSIDVTINIDNDPTFSDGSSTTRSIAENSVTDTKVGTPVTATDPAGDTLTYSLSGADAASFYLSSTTGQLTANASLDYEKKSSYTVTVTASNTYGGSQSITVTVNVTNVNEAPVFNDGTSTTRKIRMNPDTNDPIGSPVAATDPEGDTLTYSKSGAKAHLFGLDTKTGQLKNSSGDWSSGVKITMTVTDGTFTDTIEVTIEVDVTPIFSDGSTATRSIAKNAPVGTNIGSPITAKDPGKVIDHTYEIIFEGEGFHRTVNEATFSIDSNTGQLKTKALIFYNVGITYSNFKVKASNSFGGSATIDVRVTVTAAASAPVAQVSQQSPAKTDLLPNYPNPFNPETWIPYQLSKSAEVTLAIYNVKGEMVRQLELGHKAAGNYLSRSQAIYWDGKNQSGEKVATGVYFYRFTAGDFSATRKMLIIK